MHRHLLYSIRRFETTCIAKESACDLRWLSSSPQRWRIRYWPRQSSRFIYYFISDFGCHLNLWWKGISTGLSQGSWRKYLASVCESTFRTRPQSLSFQSLLFCRLSEKFRDPNKTSQVQRWLIGLNEAILDKWANSIKMSHLPLSDEEASMPFLPLQ